MMTGLLLLEAQLIAIALGAGTFLVLMFLLAVVRGFGKSRPHC